MTEAILEKIQRFAAVSGVVIGTASPVQRPPAAQLWVGWCCVEESVRFAHRTLVPAETGGGHVDQHEERRAREG